MVILKTLFRIGDGFESYDNLIFAKAGQRIKTDCFVFSVKILVRVLAEIGKHTAVIHVMAVNYAVVG